MPKGAIPVYNVNVMPNATRGMTISAIPISLICGVLIGGFGPAAHAKRFRNAYVSFELPPNWSCKLEGSEWICENDFAGKTKEAIIILTAKEVGPTDTLQEYKTHLLTPRTITGRGGVPTRSQVIKVSERQIGTDMWIDGLHLGSEVGPYFTRYLATIKEKIAVLVTFSAHKEHFTKYSGDFVRAVESLRIVASKDMIGEKDSDVGGRQGPETLGRPMGQVVTPLGSDVMPEEGSSSKGSGKYFNWLLIALVLGGVGGLIFLKTKKKDAKPARKAKR